MAKLNIDADDRIVICDGKKALILENVGDDKFFDLCVKDVRMQ